MKIVFFGTPAFAVPVLSELAERHEIVAVVTQPDRPKNRGHRLAFSEVKEEALRRGLEVLQPLSVKEAEIPDADVYVVVAYGQIFPERLLGAPKYGCLNVHASLLPKYRGAAPIQRAIEDGQEVSGVSIMKMEKGLDTGAVLLKREVAILDKDAATLSEELSRVGAELMLEALDWIQEGSAVFREQGGDFTYAHMITKQDFILDFEKTFEQNVQKIRAFGYIKTVIDDKNVKIFGMMRRDDVSDGEMEGVREKIAIRRDAVLIRFSNTWAMVTELQPENSKRMPVKSYLSGRR